MDVVTAINRYKGVPISRHMILDLLGKYRRPNDKISELVKAGVLTTLKKGLYALAPQPGVTQSEPFLVANHLWGPSYISMESALSYWGLIPERVYEVSSMTSKNSKIYQNDMGRFSYTHIGLPYYAFGIKRVDINTDQAVMLATPEKALCDKIVSTRGVLLRSVSQTLAFLSEDLRIDEDQLADLNLDEIESWLAYAPKRESISMLLKTLRAL